MQSMGSACEQQERCVRGGQEQAVGRHAFQRWYGGCRSWDAQRSLTGCDEQAGSPGLGMHMHISCQVLNTPGLPTEQGFRGA